uniref:Uncharacterized protein n=1 Tax=Anguilla anguilla TaxID=7936 RepID=A0A0E9WM83_ANGAN
MGFVAPSTFTRKVFNVSLNGRNFITLSSQFCFAFFFFSFLLQVCVQTLSGLSWPSGNTVK